MERTVAVPREALGAMAKRYVVGWLVGLNGPTRGESYAVRIGRNVLGRDKKSDIVVVDGNSDFFKVMRSGGAVAGASDATAAKKH